MSKLLSKEELASCKNWLIANMHPRDKTVEEVFAHIDAQDEEIARLKERIEKLLTTAYCVKVTVTAHLDADDKAAKEQGDG